MNVTTLRTGEVVERQPLRATGMGGFMCPYCYAKIPAYASTNAGRMGIESAIESGYSLPVCLGCDGVWEYDIADLFSVWCPSCRTEVPIVKWRVHERNCFSPAEIAEQADRWLRGLRRA